MRRVACRRNEHGYGISVAIGGGLLTRTCKRCGNVEIDLRGAARTQPGLFEPRQRPSWFDFEDEPAPKSLYLSDLDYAAGG